MNKVSLVSKELALLLRSRVVSAQRTNNFETFTVEVELPTRELVTATVGYDHEGKGLAASFDRDDITAEMIDAVRIAAVDGAKRLIEEREAGTGKLVKEHEGWNWRFTDAAGLHLSNTGHLTVPPAEVSAYRIGHVCLVLPDTLPLELARLEYVGKAFFGEPRPSRGLSSGTKWTGDAYKFAVYVYRPEFGRAHAVILRTDGSGSRFYFLDDTDSDETWRKLVEVMPEPHLWSLCQSITHTYHQGRTDEKRHLFERLKRGLLKVRKRRGGGGGLYVEELAEKKPAA
jgi:hypothetical protein